MSGPNHPPARMLACIVLFLSLHATVHAQEVAEDATAPPTWTLDDGIRVRTDDGRAEMRFGLAAALRGAIRRIDDTRAGGFSARYVRPVLSGYVVDERVRYFVQPEFAGDVRLLDAEVAVLAWPEFGVRLGLYRTQFSRQFIAPIILLALPARSFVSDWFRAGRSIGVSAEGAFADGLLHYAAGVYDGTLSDPARRDRPLLVGRLMVSPWAPVSIDETVPGRTGAAPFGLEVGVAATQGPLRQRNWLPLADGSAPDGHRRALAGELALAVGRIGVNAEVFAAWLRPDGAERIEALGAFAQLVVGLWRERLDAVARYNLLDVRDAATLQRIELGANGYVHGNVLKVQANYALDRVTGDATGLALPLLGDGHRGVLQLQLAL